MITFRVFPALLSEIAALNYPPATPADVAASRQRFMRKHVLPLSSTIEQEALRVAIAQASAPVSPPRTTPPIPLATTTTSTTAAAVILAPSPPPRQVPNTTTNAAANAVSSIASLTFDTGDDALDTESLEEDIDEPSPNSDIENVGLNSASASGPDEAASSSWGTAWAAAHGAAAAGVGVGVSGPSDVSLLSSSRSAGTRHAGIASRYRQPPSPRPTQVSAVVIGNTPIDARGIAKFIDRQAASAAATQAKVLSILKADVAAEGSVLASDAMSVGSKRIVARLAATGAPRHKLEESGGGGGGGSTSAALNVGETLYVAAQARTLRAAAARADASAEVEAAHNSKHAGPHSDALLRRRLTKELAAAVAWVAASRTSRSEATLLTSIPPPPPPPVAAAVVSREGGGGWDFDDTVLSGDDAAFDAPPPSAHESGGGDIIDSDDEDDDEAGDNGGPPDAPPYFYAPWWLVALTPLDVAVIAGAMGMLGESGVGVTEISLLAAIRNAGNMPNNGHSHSAPLMTSQSAATANVARLWIAAAAPSSEEISWVATEMLERVGSDRNIGATAEEISATLLATLGAGAAARASAPPRRVPAVRLLALLQALMTGAYDVRPRLLQAAAAAAALPGSDVRLPRGPHWRKVRGGQAAPHLTAATGSKGSMGSISTSLSRALTPDIPPAPPLGDTSATRSLDAQLELESARLRARLLSAPPLPALHHSSTVALPTISVVTAALPTRRLAPLARGVLEARVSFASDTLAPLRALVTARIAASARQGRDDPLVSVANAAINISGGGGGGAQHTNTTAAAAAACPSVVRSRGSSAAAAFAASAAECTFKPSLCEHSLELAARRTIGTVPEPREAAMMRYKADIDARHRALRLEKEAAEVSMCTFKPAINATGGGSGGANNSSNTSSMTMMGGGGGGTLGAPIPGALSRLYLPNYGALLAVAASVGGGSGGPPPSSSSATLPTTTGASSGAAIASGSRHEWLYHLASLKSAALTAAGDIATQARQVAEVVECTFAPAPHAPPPVSSSITVSHNIAGASKHVKRAEAARAEKASLAAREAAVARGATASAADRDHDMHAMAVRNARGLTMAAPFHLSSNMRPAARKAKTVANARRAMMASASQHTVKNTPETYGGGGGGVPGNEEYDDRHGPVDLASSPENEGEMPSPMGGRSGGGVFVSPESMGSLDSVGTGRTSPPPPPLPPSPTNAATISAAAATLAAAAAATALSAAASLSASHSTAEPLVFPSGEPPLLYVDVTVSAGTIERIPVWRDSDLIALSSDFALKHGLNRKMSKRLERLMAAQREAVVGAVAAAEVEGEVVY